MDSETALKLVRHGVTLLFLDVPPYTLLGVDTQVFNPGPIFKGIKMIPPGPHIVYYRSSSREGNGLSPIIGFFIDAGPSEVIVRKWDYQEERLVKISEEEEERYTLAVKNLEFDRQLGPYNLANYGEWKRLSNFITKSSIKRLEPIGGEISVVCENDVVRNTPKTSMEEALDKQLNIDNSATSFRKYQTKGCYYTTIPRLGKCKGVSVQELTSLNLDKTQLLETLLAKDYGGSENLLLGELQFSFVAFLMVQSLQAFFQWKSLVSLLFGCTEAPLHTRTQLFTKFIKVIYYQLKYGLEKDSVVETGLALFDDSRLSVDIFVHHLFKDFLSLVQDGSVVDGDLLSWTRKFMKLLESKSRVEV